MYEQETPAFAHIIVAQHQATTGPRQLACAKAQNMALSAVQTEWVLRLADDDWLGPRAIKLLLAESRDADVVFSAERRGAGGIRNVNDWSQTKLAEYLRTSDVMGPSGDMYRTELLTQYWWMDDQLSRWAFPSLVSPLLPGHMGGLRHPGYFGLRGGTLSLRGLPDVERRRRRSVSDR